MVLSRVRGDRLMDGFLVLNKPLGKTSSDCVVFVRKRLPRGTAIGHGGTLDPMASGVLPVCVGAATRLFDYIIDKQKTYVAELQLGVVTDTQDATGAVVETRSVTSPRRTCSPHCPASSAIYGKRRPCTRPSSAAASGCTNWRGAARAWKWPPRACRVDDVRPHRLSGRRPLPAGSGLRQGRLHPARSATTLARIWAVAAIWRRLSARAPACSRWKTP